MAIKKKLLGAAEDMENLHPYTLLVEMWTVAATMENRLAVPQNFKQRVAMWYITTYRYILKRNETDVHTKSIHKCC